MSRVASDGVQPAPAAGFTVEVRVPPGAGDFVAVALAVGAGAVVVAAVAGTVPAGVALLVVLPLEQPVRAAAATAATMSGIRAFTIFFSPGGPAPHPVMRWMVIIMPSRPGRRITETCHG
ncbi:hypothetical protein GCM10010168_18250 [Actinoplanes ianthinogenes]|uniref:Uncharacterized protein n=1 Tax=Actinoplanes ianthinogenes TaxID=122358 RepID=A0ABM7M732_9ACTN|nr:hypothetical protein Aiant_81240 [Actinoplanes ianthinogenes]GGR01964.1 hypothetical protein GCM10010168_18250 [Actinoplanes ianthinogenes]